MILRNPTNSHVAIQIDGTRYSVEPNATTNVSVRAHALRWLKTHKFLLIEEDSSPVEEVTAEVLTAPYVAPVEETETAPAEEELPVIHETETEKVVAVKGSKLKPKTKK